MKLTTKQLKQMIIEELNLILESTGMPKLDSLLAEDDAESIIQGLELAESFGVTIDYETILANKSRQTLKAIVRSPAGSQMPELLHAVALKTLSSMIDYTVLSRIASNEISLPKTLEMLARLKGSNENNIVSKVARNPNTPVEVLVELSNHKSWVVRAGVAAQEKTPTDILKKLMSDSEAIVRNSASATHYIQNSTQKISENHESS